MPFSLVSPCTTQPWLSVLPSQRPSLPVLPPAQDCTQDTLQGILCLPLPTFSSIHPTDVGSVVTSLNSFLWCPSPHPNRVNSWHHIPLNGPFVFGQISEWCLLQQTVSSVGIRTRLVVAPNCISNSAQSPAHNLSSVNNHRGNEWGHSRSC